MTKGEIFNSTSGVDSSADQALRPYEKGKYELDRIE